jgi:hypothetical protein
MTAMRVIEMNVPKQLPNVVYTIHCFQKCDAMNHTSIGGTEAGTSIVSQGPRLPNSPPNSTRMQKADQSEKVVAMPSCLKLGTFKCCCSRQKLHKRICNRGVITVTSALYHLLSSSNKVSHSRCNQTATAKMGHAKGNVLA